MVKKRKEQSNSKSTVRSLELRFHRKHKAEIGNSTLIAAMTNYLGFDVYDLELTAVRSDSDLRRLLIRTANWSIIVVEDIDCSLSLDSLRTATPKGVEVLLQSRIWG
ncbi:hypothetical protein RJ639_009070 [Escallonia herrerae]|uniref:Uncharacterized protein n=1 Tax=Escallonia herrerae TaxID=1293975 RepID=A0AA88VSS3_9ASTE|nr:hypothetical protein RJ639_009070 [Escallonia herrerae]